MNFHENHTDDSEEDTDFIMEKVSHKQVNYTQPPITKLSSCTNYGVKSSGVKIFQAIAIFGWPSLVAGVAKYWNK